LHNQTKPAGATDLWSSLLAACSNEWGIHKLRYQVIYPIRYDFWDWDMTYLGQIANPLVNQNLCAVITKKTGLSGRRFVGRWRVPGQPASAMAAGHFIGAHQTLLHSVADRWTTMVAQDQGAGRLAPCLYHPKADGAAPYHEITDYTLNLDVRTQRTRNVGKGI
jgi:hypothetical protein